MTRYHVEIGDRAFEVDIEGGEFRLDGRVIEARLDQSTGTPIRSLHVDGRTFRLVADRSAKGDWSVRLGGRGVRARVIDERTKAIRDASGHEARHQGPKPVVAPMPGMVVKVEVAEGDRVEAGQGVVIVEAMKMENELRAAGPGVVGRVHVAEGQAVEKDQVLIDLVADGAAAD